MINRIKAEQRGSNILYTCYGKVLAVNGVRTMASFNVVPSIQKELLERLR